MSTPDEIVAEGSQQLFNRPLAEIRPFEKILLAIGGSICFAAFWFCGDLFHIPAYLHFSASLLQQPNLASTLVIAAIIYAVSVLIGTIVCGTVGFDAGIFCASIGLLALSARGGPIRYTLFAATGSNIWITQAMEIALLALFAGAGGMLQRMLSRIGLLREDRQKNQILEVHDAIDQKLLALATNVVVIAVMMMILSASDYKMQVICSAGISSFVATLLAYYLVPTEPSAWYWVAPLVVGVMGYLFQYFGNISAWRIGETQGAFAALARPLPLDYAGSGVAFSIFGYWVARKWHRETAYAETSKSVN